MAEETPRENAEDAAAAEQAGLADQEKNANSGSNGEEKPVYATGMQKLYLALGLMLVTGLVFAGWLFSIKKVDAQYCRPHEVQWAKPDGFLLEPGPVSFRYDSKDKKLIHRGPMSDKLKQQLKPLLQPLRGASLGEEKISGEKGRYWLAVNDLAYSSSQTPTIFLIWLLVLGGLSGVLGVQLRSISDFIGNAAYKNQLEIQKYWPLYMMRPALGFLLGLVAVLLIKADLWEGTTEADSGTTWWLAITFIVGFGAFDFSERLRLLSKTLFGTSSPSNGEEKKGKKEGGEKQGQAGAG